MICVECGEPVSSSYTRYSNDYIKLTDCSRCHCTADKYIELDNVVLFIDILLLKPQAYKHLVFNAYLNKSETSSALELNKNHEELKEQVRSKKIKRIRILSILFEIYLSWAYQEKNFNATQHTNPYSIYHKILVMSVMTQYFYFGLKCSLEDFLTHRLVHWFVFRYFGWKPDINYATNGYKSQKSGNETLSGARGNRVHKKPQSFKDKLYLNTVISLTIVISSGMKLFPILMLIWPYDDLTITNIIVVIANFNLVESLRIVTGLRIRQTVLIFGVLTLVKFAVTRLALSVLISHGNFSEMKLLLLNEMYQLKMYLLNGVQWLQMYI